MPRLCNTSPLLAPLIRAQDFVVHRDQLFAHGVTAGSIKHRLATRTWGLMLPDVYLTHSGEPTRRQMLIAARLYAGADAAIDGVDACRFHGLRAVTLEDDQVHVVVPADSPARTRSFVVVRRTSAPIRVVSTELLRYVEPAAAAIAAARGATTPRGALAILSDALQRKVTTYDDLVRAHIQGPPRNARWSDQALGVLATGIRSTAEDDFRRLAAASVVLPALEYNILFKLPRGRLVRVDALIRTSAVVHEVNGRVAHMREDLFEDMQERSDALTAAGFVVLHNSPRRLRAHGREVIAEVERTHRRYDGRGMPRGVEIIASAV
jgi:hypothetical protein